jgi:ABC-type nitrate/sulfonate/bicarbonate transport system ATPase subunit
MGSEGKYSVIAGKSSANDRTEEIQFLSRPGEARMVSDAIRRVGLEWFALCAAHELSEGMAQAGGHCASTRSSALTGFAGSSFSTLASFNRTKLQNHFLKIWGVNYPILVVPHDIDDALFFDDRAIILGRDLG